VSHGPCIRSYAAIPVPLFKGKDGAELKTAICCNERKASSTCLLRPIKIFVTSKTSLEDELQYSNFLPMTSVRIEAARSLLEDALETIKSNEFRQLTIP